MGGIDKGSLAAKATRSMMVVTFSILVLATLLSVLSESLISYRVHLNAIKIMANVAGENLTAALSFNNKKSASLTLSSLSADPQVEWAGLYNRQLQKIAEYRRSNSHHVYEVAEFPSSSFHSLSWNHLTYVRPIHLDNTPIGVLVVHTKLTELINVVGKTILGGLLILVITTPLTYLLANRFQKPISEPILALSKTMRTVSETGDYDVTIASSDSDEINALVDGFNFMVDAIKEREARLSHENETLESKVQERTNELQDANRVLREARDAAESSAKTKTEFLANMSHEIRTPMNGVLGASELALSASTDKERVEFLGMIRSSAKILLSVINDILDYSKIEAGKFRLLHESFSLRSAISDSINVCAAMTTRKGLCIVVNIDPKIPERVIGDDTRLKQVLVNLIGNSVKFTAEHGAVIVMARLKKITSASATIFIAVNDTGIGIPEDKRDSIFGAFSQGDSSLTRKYGGTGLGLSISNQLVSMMGGKIDFKSKVGVGSSFFFEIDVALPKYGETSSDKIVSEPPEATSTLAKIPQLNVLLVEDNVVNQRIAKAMLNHLGHIVTIAGNGAEAIELHEKEYFDLILMDCQMPVMDGYEATRVIRERELQSEAHVPIVALTAHAMAGDKEWCLIRGMDDYLSKPMTTADLKNVLERYYGTKR